MNFYEFEKKMKAFECRTTTIPPDTWIVLHVDGDNFHTFVKDMGYERPFDSTFHGKMESVGKRLLEVFDGVFAYLQSDEINLLLPLNYNEFNRDLAKIVSKSVSIASSQFTHDVERLVGFATHVYSLPSETHVIDYFRWRQSDCFRNCFNAYCYWHERENGSSPARATKKFDGMNVKEKIQYLHDAGVQNIPEWQKWGTGLSWETYEKDARNPITNEAVTCTRKRLVSNKTLPHGDDLSDLLIGVIV